MSTLPMDSAQQFIGSKISLTSKSDIRYEGTFYCLDLREATISLAKVRSFGTEDRPTDRPIPMKDEIYEFIVFRGSDIKSIDVLAPPQRGSTMPCGLPQDPAIVEVSHFTRGGGISHGGHGGHGHHCHEPNCRDHPVRYPSQRDGVFDSLLRGSGRSQRGNQRRTSNDNGNQPDRSRNNGGRQSNRGERNPEGRSRQEYRGGSSSGNNGPNERNQESRRGRGNSSPTRNNQGNSNANNRNNRESSRNRNQQARQRGIIEPQLPPKVTFEDPFDFEKSNEELKTAMEKLKLSGDEDNKEADASGSTAVEKKEEPLIYYDKDKFFDNISCEALERKQGKTGRVDWRAERKLNAETFGLPWNPNQPRTQRNGNFGRPRNNFRGYRGGMRYNYNRYSNRNSSFGNGFNNGGGGNRGQP